MSKQSGLILKHEQEKDDLLEKSQGIVIQFMIDTLQITMREDYGWGYDRIMKLTEKWTAKRQEYKHAIEPENKEADVKQKHMQNVFEDICAKKKIRPIAFNDRYPFLKRVRYDRPYKEKKKKWK